MPDLSNPHDRFFKEVFSRPEMAADVLANYLPEEIVALLDLSQLELVKDSFIDSQLQEHLSDLLYKVRLRGAGVAYVYLLFEHKSAPDPQVAFQLLRYAVRIWEMLLEQKVKPLPVIFPLVLYHGRKAWKAHKNFAALVDLQGREALRPYVPDFHYHLLDLSAYGETEIKGEAFSQAFLAVLKYIFREDLGERFEELLSRFRDLPPQSLAEHLRTVLIYLARASDKRLAANLNRAAKKVLTEEGGFMPSIAEAWIEEGMQKGLQQGLQQGSALLTLRQLHRRFGTIDARTQKQIHALSFEELEELGEALLDFNTKTDLKVWLSKHPRK
ncbi:MAG: Rpn family recombination-promoting nuclease/putative transposase [Acidobacteria bacterium]|nr:Rpn family recombination-promoting nuclease/putative transposase [Acidobacteriota bacterium]